MIPYFKKLTFSCYFPFCSPNKHEIHVCFIKQLYPMVVLREMPFCHKIYRKTVHGMEHFTASCKTYDNLIIYFTEKINKSLQLTIALYYLPIQLSMTTIYNFIPFYARSDHWSPDWKMLPNLVCRTGHSSRESPCTSLTLVRASCLTTNSTVQILSTRSTEQ